MIKRERETDRQTETDKVRKILAGKKSSSLFTSEHIPELTGFPLRWCRRGKLIYDKERDRQKVSDRQSKKDTGRAHGLITYIPELTGFPLRWCRSGKLIYDKERETERQ